MKGFYFSHFYSWKESNISASYISVLLWGGPLFSGADRLSVSDDVLYSTQIIPARFRKMSEGTELISKIFYLSIWSSFKLLYSNWIMVRVEAY